MRLVDCPTCQGTRYVQVAPCRLVRCDACHGLGAIDSRDDEPAPAPRVIIDADPLWSPAQVTR